MTPPSTSTERTRQLWGTGRLEQRFGVAVLGIDEHIWHHAPRPGKGPMELTGMVDLTRDADGKPRARLLDLVAAGRRGRW